MTDLLTKNFKADKIVSALIELAFGKDLNPDNYNNIAAGG
jgi:hypothetical protein